LTCPLNRGNSMGPNTHRLRNWMGKIRLGRESSSVRQSAGRSEG
jgi:hypothetical protein